MWGRRCQIYRGFICCLWFRKPAKVARSTDSFPLCGRTRHVEKRVVVDEFCLNRVFTRHNATSTALSIETFFSLPGWFSLLSLSSTTARRIAGPLLVCGKGRVSDHIRRLLLKGEAVGSLKIGTGAVHTCDLSPFAPAFLLQAGTEQGNDFRDVAVRATDGAALLAGWTHDDWVADGTTNFYSEMAGVLIETGAEAPPPTPVIVTPAPVGSATSEPSAGSATLEPSAAASATPETAAPLSASSCGATESFQVTSVAIPEIEGCFQATSLSYSTGDVVEVWTVSGELSQEEVAIFGNWDDGTGEVVGHRRTVALAGI